jgi:hypothetical protein
MKGAKAPSWLGFCRPGFQSGHRFCPRLWITLSTDRPVRPAQRKGMPLSSTLMFHWASPVCCRTPRCRDSCMGREPTWALVGAGVTHHRPLIWSDFVSHTAYVILSVFCGLTCRGIRLQDNARQTERLGCRLIPHLHRQRHLLHLPHHDDLPVRCAPFSAARVRRGLVERKPSCTSDTRPRRRQAGNPIRLACHRQDRTLSA